MQGLQTAASAHRGVGRYTEKLVSAIISQNTEHEIFLALNGEFAESIDGIKAIFHNLLPEERVVVWFNHLTTANSSSPSFKVVEAAEILRESFFASFEPDVIVSTNLQEGANDNAVTSVLHIAPGAIYITTLHDLVPYHYKDRYIPAGPAADWYYRKINHALNSEIILTDSEAAKLDILNFLDVNHERVFVIPCAADTKTFNASPLTMRQRHAVMCKFGITKSRFVFYCGGIDEHKNWVRLVRAFAQIPLDIRQNVNLVLGGRDFPGNETLAALVKDLDLAVSVLTPGFISNEDLRLLLKSALCFVFPSTHEGFGLPALEAMACGTPVLGSNSSSVREVIENPEALFDPYDVQDIQRLVTLALTDESYRRRLRKSGLKQSRKYSWDKSGRKFLDLISKVTQNKQISQESLCEPIDIAIRNLSEISRTMSRQDRIGLARSIADTFPRAGKPKLYLDISSIVLDDHRTGIQRVTRAISREMLETNVPNRQVELVWTTPTSDNFYTANEFMQQHFSIDQKQTDEYVEFKRGDILFMLDLHPGVAINHRKHFQSLRAKGVKIYHVVYDLLPLQMPNFFWPEVCTEFRMWIETVSYSDGALCISKSVARELRDYLGGGKMGSPLFKIGYFHCGADFENSVPSRGRPDDADWLLLRFSERPTFIMVGTIEPRKGHQQVLQAFDELWRGGADINLVIVGKLGNSRWDAGAFLKLMGTERERGNRLHWLANVSDEYLHEMYCTATCLIAASEGEGFGLPLIEAAQLGLPILARDIPVFREVSGEHATYFTNSTDPKLLADSINAWCERWKDGLHISSKNMPWQKWKRSAQQILDVVENNKWLYFC